MKARRFACLALRPLTARPFRRLSADCDFNSTRCSGDRPVLADASRPNGATGNQRNAGYEENCFGPRQYPIARHAAPQSLDCRGYGGFKLLMKG